jgi:uncharacterized integral membrane protein
MQWMYLILIILFAVATAVFAFQNFELVTISFFRVTAQAPLALLVVGFYLLGAATGSSVFALLRHSYERSRRSNSLSSGRH